MTLLFDGFPRGNTNGDLFVADLRCQDYNIYYISRSSFHDLYIYNTVAY